MGEAKAVVFGAFKGFDELLRLEDCSHDLFQLEEVGNEEKGWG
jgi:hypothetical protein